MLVRFKQAAEAVIDGFRKWVHAGHEGEIAAEHFDPAVHEDLTPPADPASPADGVPAETEKASG